MPKQRRRNKRTELLARYLQAAWVAWDHGVGPSYALESRIPDHPGECWYDLAVGLSRSKDKPLENAITKAAQLLCGEGAAE